jgi:hypothetical protein
VLVISPIIYAELSVGIEKVEVLDTLFIRWLLPDVVG